MLNLPLQKGVILTMRTITAINIICFVIGFIFVFGSVGAIDCNTIPFDQFIIQTCVGFVFMFGGIALGV